MQLQALSLINHSKHSLKHIQNHTSLLKSVFLISSHGRLQTSFLISTVIQEVSKSWPGQPVSAAVLFKQGVMHELEKGVKPNLADYDKRTALHLASCEGCTEIVDLLLHKGADVNSMDRWGRTPLSDARSFSHEAICKILEARGGIDPAGLDSQLPCYEIEHTEVNMDEAMIIGEVDFVSSISSGT